MSLRYVPLFLLMLAATAQAAEPAREPGEVARELLEVYGKQLDDLTYIPALAVHSRWRFAELSGEKEYADEVQELAAPYLRGTKSAKTDSHVAIAGHLVLAGLLLPEVRRYRKGPSGPGERDAWGLTADQGEYAKLVRTAADRLFEPAPSHRVRPPRREEMSDAVFMCGPILCEAARGEDKHKYFAAAVTFLTKMIALRQREDDLYAHGHLCDAAWGRGNGFPAVGMAWCLSLLPESHAGRDELLGSYRRHMAALLRHQGVLKGQDDGMWHQVIDRPSSDAEFTCTCMIGFAMQRGISRGWLNKAKYQPAVDRAWRAICERIEPDGKLLAVCESTGTQRTEKDYLNRRLNDGVDHRGGAMALLFATELMAAKKKK